MSNIILEYRVIILRGEEAWNCRLGCEFFQDEHGVQWVKFFPSNGYRPHQEHIMRTENIVVVRDDDKARPAVVA